MSTTHVRINRELAERLRVVSQFTSVSISKLVDHIVADALPVYEKQVTIMQPLGKVPGFGDARTAEQIALAAARQAEAAVREAKTSLHVARAWAEAAVVDKAPDRDAPRTPGPKKQVRHYCQHLRVKVTSWGGRICQDCSAVLKS